MKTKHIFRVGDKVIFRNKDCFVEEIYSVIDSNYVALGGGSIVLLSDLDQVDRECVLEE